MSDASSVNGRGRETVVASVARTAIGRFEGALASVDAVELGAVAIRAALERARVRPEVVDEVYVGQVLTAGVGQAPARQAARRAGVPASVPCTTVNKVCGSSLKAAMIARAVIRVGDADVVVAAGMESMSRAPYLMPRARAGYRMGNQTVVDAMIHDGLWDPFDDVAMGSFGDGFARAHDVSREAQDAYTRETYERALEAQKAGLFAREIVPMDVRQGSAKAASRFDTDEEPARYDAAKMATLRGAFAVDGTVTAANASKINDGAAAVVLASREAATRFELPVRATVLADATFAGDAPDFPSAPAHAIARAAKRAGIAVRDIDCFEISEAFAIVPIVTMRTLGIARDRVNVWGGGISLGHPIGASGARLLVTLVSALEARDGAIGCATLCLGGGEAVAMIVRRER